MTTKVYKFMEQSIANYFADRMRTLNNKKATVEQGQGEDKGWWIVTVYE